MASCIFCQIADHTLPAKLVYEDANVVAFHDLHPKAPVHVLICPKKHIATLNDVSAADHALLGQVFEAAQKVAKQFGIHEKGYQTVINVNADGGQTIYHLHLHVIGGRRIDWPA